MHPKLKRTASGAGPAHKVSPNKVGKRLTGDIHNQDLENSNELTDDEIEVVVAHSSQQNEVSNPSFKTVVERFGPVLKEVYSSLQHCSRVTAPISYIPTPNAEHSISVILPQTCQEASGTIPIGPSDNDDIWFGE